MDVSLYLSKWLSKIIIRTCSANIKEKFRKIEKQWLKLVKLECHLAFNEACMNNDLLPVYTNVKLHDDAVKSESFVLEFRKNLVQRQINEQKSSIDSLHEEIFASKSELRAAVNSKLRYRAFILFIQKECAKSRQELLLVQ